MERQIQLLKNAGIEEIVLAVSVMADVVRKYFGDGKKFGLKIHYTDEKFPAGTGGAIKLAESYLKDDNFFMLNGDVILNFDFKKMLAFHIKSKGIGTISSKIVNDPDTGLPMNQTLASGQPFVEEFTDEQTAKARAIELGWVFPESIE